MTTADRARPSPPDAVAAAEADIEKMRRQLDLALSSIRRELSLPIAAAAGMATLLDRAVDAERLRDFLRRNAAPLGIIALGAAG